MDRRVLQRGTWLVLLLFAFALRLSGLTAQSLWRDEVDALRFSQASLTTLVGNFSQPGWNGPLFYVLLRFWVALAGSSEFAMRAFSLWFGVLGVALVYRLGRTWFSPLIGGLAALLTSCSPYLVWYAQEAKMYAMLCALAVGTLYLYHQVLETGDWRLWMAIMVLTWFTTGVHIMGALLVPVMVLLFFAWWPLSRRQWRQGGLALIGVLLPGIAALPWALPLLIRGGDIGHRFASLPQMVTTMLYAFSRGIVDVGGLVPMGLSLFVLLAGSLLWSSPVMQHRWYEAVSGARRSSPGTGAMGEQRFVLATWVWMAVPLLGLYAISLRVPMFVDRYLIWTGPAFYVLAARGLDQIRHRSAFLAGLCLVALLVISGWGVWQQSATPIKSDFRAAAAYVRQHRQPDELILFHISYVRETFEYYYGDAAPAHGGVPTDERTTQSAVDQAMQDRVSGHKVVWLVLSEPEMWDQRGLTAAWLESHARQELRVDFTRVTVIKYRLETG